MKATLLNYTTSLEGKYCRRNLMETQPSHFREGLRCVPMTNTSVRICVWCRLLSTELSMHVCAEGRQNCVPFSISVVLISMRQGHWLTMKSLICGWVGMPPSLHPNCTGMTVVWSYAQFLCGLKGPKLRSWCMSSKCSYVPNHLSSTTLVFSPHQFMQLP